MSETKHGSRKTAVDHPLDGWVGCEHDPDHYVCAVCVDKLEARIAELERERDQLREALETLRSRLQGYIRLPGPPVRHIHRQYFEGDLSVIAEALGHPAAEPSMEAEQQSSVDSDDPRSGTPDPVARRWLRSWSTASATPPPSNQQGARHATHQTQAKRPRARPSSPPRSPPMAEHSKFIQILIGPEDVKWQGNLIALDDNGRIWVSAGHPGAWVEFTDPQEGDDVAF